MNQVSNQLTAQTTIPTVVAVKIPLDLTISEGTNPNNPTNSNSPHSINSSSAASNNPLGSRGAKRGYPTPPPLHQKEPEIFTNISPKVGTYSNMTGNKGGGCNTGGKSQYHRIKPNSPQNAHTPHTPVKPPPQSSPNYAIVVTTGPVGGQEPILREVMFSTEGTGTALVVSYGYLTHASRYTRSQVEPAVPTATPNVGMHIHQPLRQSAQFRPVPPPALRTLTGFGKLCYEVSNLGKTPQRAADNDKNSPTKLTALATTALRMTKHEGPAGKQALWRSDSPPPSQDEGHPLQVNLGPRF